MWGSTSHKSSSSHRASPHRGSLTARSPQGPDSGPRLEVWLLPGSSLPYSTFQASLEDLLCARRQRTKYIKILALRSFHSSRREHSAVISHLHGTHHGGWSYKREGRQGRGRGKGGRWGHCSCLSFSFSSHRHCGSLRPVSLLLGPLYPFPKWAQMPQLTLLPSIGSLQPDILCQSPALTSCSQTFFAPVG